MKRSAAFTLVELLIVVAILGILVTILIPTVVDQIEEARKVKCGGNLSAIGKKMIQYAHSHKGQFPVADAVFWTGPGSAVSNKWGGMTNGTYRTVKPTGGADVPVTCSQWILVELDYLPVKAFICPSTDDTPDDFTGADGVVRQEGLYDFKSRDNISYSFQVPYGCQVVSVLSPAGLGLAADKSPFFDNPTGTRIMGISPADNSRSSNSHNHGQEGQNLVTVSGDVSWAKTANAGIGGDHIFSRYQTGENVAPAQARFRRIGVIYDHSGTIEEDDTVLAP